VQASEFRQRPSGPSRARCTAVMTPEQTISPTDVERLIFTVRGHRVMIDRDLAEMYGVETKVLNQAVRRNPERFPSDFVFRLRNEEVERLRSQFVTANIAPARRRGAPYAFTEQGVAMLSSVLRSSRAVAVNIEIMRAFVRLRRLLLENVEPVLRPMQDDYCERRSSRCVGRPRRCAARRSAATPALLPPRAPASLRSRRSRHVIMHGSEH
jgi:hypothetical protein